MRLLMNNRAAGDNGRWFYHDGCDTQASGFLKAKPHNTVSL